MRFFILIGLLWSVGCFSQPNDSIYCSESLGQVLVYESVGLNRSKPEVWLLYNVGLNAVQDTIAMDRDSVFIVSFSGYDNPNNCTLFSDSHGQSFYCVLYSASRSEYLKANGFQTYQGLSIDSNDTLVSVINKRVLRSIKKCGEGAYEQLTGSVLVQVVVEKDTLNLMSLPFVYEGRGQVIHDERILSDFHFVQLPVVQRLGELEFIRASYEFLSFEGQTCFENSSGDCECYTSWANGRYDTRLLRVTEN